MEPSDQLILGFVATLLATLIGVHLGFKYDRLIKGEEKRQRVLNRIHSVKSELAENDEAATRNFQLLSNIQKGNADEAEHYSLSLYSVNAWEAALQGDVVEIVDRDTYNELQSLYSNIQRTNEHIRQVRTEFLHSRIGGSVEPYDIEVWTIALRQWNPETEEVEVKGLGDIILSESKTIRVDIRSVSEDLEDLIEKLEDESSNDQKPVVKSRYSLFRIQ